MKVFQFVMCVTSFLIGGCSGESDKATPVESKKENILEHQVQSLEKAKEVESLLQTSADNLRKDIEEQTSAKLVKSPKKTGKKQLGSGRAKGSVEVIPWDIVPGKNWSKPAWDQENWPED